jgi:4a-hydroxytetrahydrobiopterin dehydratase
MKTELADGKCSEKAVRLKSAEIRSLKKQLPDHWKVVKPASLEKQFKFRDFKQALAFTNLVGWLAEKQGHHPDIYLTYGAVRLQLSTHSAGGLTLNDFILAAKVERLN